MSSAKEGILVYGATGYTGRLVSRRLKELGLPATLAGRSEPRLREIANEVSLPFEAFELSDDAKLNEMVGRHSVVLHIAGPFSVTARPMLEACLHQKTHYLDIAGEIQVLQLAHSLHSRALESNVMLLPAIGFDVIPGDCLAAYLRQEKLPTATQLDLATFIIQKSRVVASSSPPSSSSALPSMGTALSGAIHIIPNGGKIIRFGHLKQEPIGRRSFEFQMGKSVPPVQAMSFPCAELFAAQQSTSIPNITTYVPGHGGWTFGTLLLNSLQLAKLWPFRPLLEFAVKRLPTANEEQDSTAVPVRMQCAAEAKDEATGQRAAAVVTVASGYKFTAASAVEVARRVLEGNFKAGYQTPSSAYGWSLVKEIPVEPAAELVDIEEPAA